MTYQLSDQAITGINTIFIMLAIFGVAFVYTFVKGDKKRIKRK